MPLYCLGRSPWILPCKVLPTGNIIVVRRQSYPEGKLKSSGKCQGCGEWFSHFHNFTSRGNAFWSRWRRNGGNANGFCCGTRVQGHRSRSATPAASCTTAALHIAYHVAEPLGLRRTEPRKMSGVWREGFFLMIQNFPKNCNYKFFRHERIILSDQKISRSRRFYHWIPFFGSLTESRLQKISPKDETGRKHVLEDFFECFNYIGLHS